MLFWKISDIYRIFVFSRLWSSVISETHFDAERERPAWVTFRVQSIRFSKLSVLPRWRHAEHKPGHSGEAVDALKRSFSKRIHWNSLNVGHLPNIAVTVTVRRCSIFRCVTVSRRSHRAPARQLHCTVLLARIWGRAQAVHGRKNSPEPRKWIDGESIDINSGKTFLAERIVIACVGNKNAKRTKLYQYKDGRHLPLCFRTVGRSIFS